MLDLRIGADESAVGWLSDALLELDALAVSVEDADANTHAEEALFGEPGMPPPEEAWHRSVVSALFDDAELAKHAIEVLQLQPQWATASVISLEPVPDLDWVRQTQQQFEPVAITPSFWVVPSWHEVPAQAERVIRLDPGLAFGTGTHPTTRMCLGWIAANDMHVKGKRVMDYGCGSGILGIAAALHGAAEVHGVDIDEAAVSAARTNAQDNGVVMRVTGAAQPVPDQGQSSFDVVLANILATPLRLLAPAICGLMAPGGHLVLAGILERQSDELREAYAPWVSLRVTDLRDGWILMTGEAAGSKRG